MFPILLGVPVIQDAGVGLYEMFTQSCLPLSRTTVVPPLTLCLLNQAPQETSTTRP